MAEDAEQQYVVVINAEEQYALWPTFRTVPPGWRAVGNPGSSDTCLKYIEDVWTDMRPLSLRKALADATGEANGTGSGN
jgi:MbtH protein